METKPNEMCVCGWKGDSFEQHHQDTIFDDNVHVEISPLMLQILGPFGK